MTDLINKVKDAKKVLNDAQEELLCWCQTSNETLDKRFQIWEDFVDKSETSYMRFNSDLLRSLFEHIRDVWDMERRQTISYDTMLDFVNDAGEDDNFDGIITVLNKHKQHIRDTKIVTILTEDDEISTDTVELVLSTIKEEIIRANFGHTTFDW